MSDYKTTGPRDNQTNDGAAAHRGQWSVVGLPRRSPRAKAGSQRLSRENAFTLPKQRGPESVRGFTLAELLVSVFVLVLLVFLFTQLLNSAATVTILGNKRMDADSQARQVFDRMAIDFAQMVKRTDVDYYIKTTLNDEQRMLSQNDRMAFYSNVPGYYPSSGAQSPLSLVAYRVNSDSTSSSYNKLERLGKGLVWNGSPASTPLVFLPQTIGGTWPAAVSSSLADPDGNYEVIGPDVFRFEYAYLLGPLLNITPCTGTYPNCLNAWRGVTAIVVDIAVIDPRSKVLLTPDQIAKLNTQGSLVTNTFLPDVRSDDNVPGKTINKWQVTINNLFTNTSWPRPAISGIRVYERYFYLTD